MQQSLRTFLIERAAIPPSRVDELLRVLREHWVTEVSSLQRCLPALEKHLPAAAYYSICGAMRSGGHDSGARSRCEGPSHALAPVEVAVELTDRISSGPRAAAHVHGTDRQAGEVEAVRGSEEQRERRAEAARQTAQYRRTLRRMKRCSVDPDSVRLRRWDALVGAAVLFTATVTPFEVGLLTARVDALWVVNRAVDAVLLADVALRLVRPFRSPRHEGGRWVRDRRRIVRRYLCSWLALDLAAAMPVETIYQLSDPVAATEGALAAVERVSASQPATRLLLLLRALKLLRLPGHLGACASRLGLRVGTADVVRWVGALLLTTHWLACVWAFVGRHGGGSGGVEANVTELSRGLGGGLGQGHHSWVERAGMVGVPAGELYGACVSAALANAVGGGREGEPASHSECYALALMKLAGGVAWLWALSQCVARVAARAPGAASHTALRGQARDFARASGLPPELGARMQDCLVQSRALERATGQQAAGQQAAGQQALLDAMSARLRGDTAHAVGSALLGGVAFLTGGGVEPDFVSAAALSLDTACFCAAEGVPCSA